MKIIEHQCGNSKAVEILSAEILINTEKDALDLMVDIEYQYHSKTIIVYKKNICEDFFDLKTGVAGTILQKFITYKVQLAIIGDFAAIKSKNFADFIYESNKSNQILFLNDVSTALKKF